MGWFSTEEEDFGTRKNKGVLYGTVTTYECDSEEDCKACEASGRCSSCEGEGTLVCGDCKGDGTCHDCGGEGNKTCGTCGGKGTCRDCGGSGTRKCSGCGGRNGSGKCNKCDGKGYRNVGTSLDGRGYTERCDSCGGTGHCHYCHGSGTKECTTCDGSGHCRKCEGSGKVECGSCDGSGRCHRCEGDGRVRCDDCKGSGECRTCDGHGRVECTRCKGTGAYQQFTVFEIEGIRESECFTGSTEYAKCIREATGSVVFDGVQKKWSRDGVVELDRTEEVSRLGRACDKDLYSESEAQYKFFLDDKTPKDENIFPYRKTIKIEDVKVARIEYIVDGTPYVMIVMGDNNTVACEGIPKTIEALKLSFFEKTKLLAMTLFRKKEYAQLAHYIFKIDGVAEAEQRMLNVAIKKCCSSPKDEEKFREELKKFDPATLSFEDLRKQMKALFASKKLIAFVWQCIAVDKKVSPKEEELFKKVVAEYKNVTPEQVEKIKGLAARIAKLSDEEILDEYLTVRN